MTTNSLFSSGCRLISRSDLLAVLRAALSAGAARFARQAALSWLAYYPGDLPVNLLYARALLQAGREDQALEVLENVTQADPECLEAQDVMASALRTLVKQGLPAPEAAPHVADCRAAIYTLGGRPEDGVPLPVWSQILRQARQSLEEGYLEIAEDLVHRALLAEPTPALVAVTHLKVAAARNLPSRAMQDLAGFYRLRFPKLLAPALLLADALMEGGEADRAVALLHQTVANDVTGQVAARLWGARHPYRGLWPDRLEAPFELAIPADVASQLGWNRLPTAPPQEPRPAPPPPESAPAFEPAEGLVAPAGAFVGVSAAATHPGLGGWADERFSPASEAILMGPPAPCSCAETQESRLRPPEAAGEADGGRSPAPQEDASVKIQAPGERPSRPIEPYAACLPESLRSVQAELDRLANRLRRNHLASTDGRFPVYVMLTTRAGLESQYGAQAMAEIEQEMKRLASAIAARGDWAALTVFADDPACMAVFGLQPAPPRDPWALKLILADLDDVLSRQGEMIGALLIVGGPEVVPFHHLPNPVDDADADVPSDNPYATRDENYFVPEWPVGRLPGGAQPNAQLLQQALRRIIERQLRAVQARPWLKRWGARLRARLWPFGRRRPSWGYSAAVWRRASLSVFRPIGEPHAMLVSPPVQVDGKPGRTRRNGHLPSARLGYFNLHGLQDSSEWYGQRDPAEPLRAPDYPVALRPQDVASGKLAPEVVFTEACYGAHILSREVDQALALKFLAAGSQAVAGSTCTAYGSIASPLIAADLLGHAFWRFLQDGLPAGEALRRAKIHLAREMHSRQGYLDGEDQKTLISFVLYGDPLAQATETSPRVRNVLRAAQPLEVKTVCDRGGCDPTPLSAKSVPSLSSETLAQVKRVVQQYLPGMVDAQLTFCQEQAHCSGQGHTCPTSVFGAKSRPDLTPDRRVVTLSKQVTEAAQGAENGSTRIHRHYARLTLDSGGKLVKVAISR